MFARGNLSSALRFTCFLSAEWITFQAICAAIHCLWQKNFFKLIQFNGFFRTQTKHCQMIWQTTNRVNGFRREKNEIELNWISLMLCHPSIKNALQFHKLYFTRNQYQIIRDCYFHIVSVVSFYCCHGCSTFNIWYIRREDSESTNRTNDSLDSKFTKQNENVRWDFGIKFVQDIFIFT